ncbi:FKBP-type peptidyl-prolyl cis-trans isomerase [Robertkochia aurantiaca]|uniref:FKBP-type peptidyl-prolyl cis-trans isomerase n=1 Tax=Robertkochia aurantiaca TaxID=2873700 RepID=UPI001CCBAE91|nr:hypothetical protein [Robertkochia sp. 3YJGBD-33]
MINLKQAGVILVGSLIFTACSNDDDTQRIEIRDAAEVALEDDAEIRSYLSTHFYNYEEFANPPADFDNKIVFDTIAGPNAGKTPMIEQVSTKVIPVRTGDGRSVDHTLYFLVAREGIGEKPQLGHGVVVNYFGNLLNGNSFDSSVTETFFTTLGVIRGYAELFPNLGVSSGFTENADGTVNWNDDYGIGAVFIPSGLGYFSDARPGIPSYSPLIFRTSLFSLEDVDQDFIRTSPTTQTPAPDGIPSHLEDVDGDGNPRNDDTDDDGLANFEDADDDGDGILTEFEYDADGDGVVDDSNGDGTPDYLDPEWPKVPGSS